MKRTNKNSPSGLLNRHSRKLTLSLIFITISYFTLTFPSTVIFSFFRSYIEPPALRRTLSHLFTNLSTTTHVIRFFIYFVCSIDFRNDFYNLFLFKRSLRLTFINKQKQDQHTPLRHGNWQIESILVSNKNPLSELWKNKKWEDLLLLSDRYIGCVFFLSCTNISGLNLGQKKIQPNNVNFIRSFYFLVNCTLDRSSLYGTKYSVFFSDT